MVAKVSICLAPGAHLLNVWPGATSSDLFALTLFKRLTKSIFVGHRIVHVWPRS